MRLAFDKLSGAGNDFILLEGRSGGPRLARRLCPRRSAVGADGVLLVSKGRNGAAAKLEYFNADGSRAFCGNGTRCAAWWVHRAGWAGKKFALDTMEGRVLCSVTGKERVRISMPPARGLRPRVPVSVAGKTYLLGAVNTGVPHAVLRVKGPLEKADVVGLGRALRRSAAFAPAGANVNFVELKGARVRVRTYERGVEDETMACGTGAVAAAMLASAWTGRKPPISVAARGGDLRVGWGADGVWLEGPARITYSGEAAL